MALIFICARNKNFIKAQKIEQYTCVLVCVISAIFFSTQKTYYDLRGAGLKPFTLSVIMLQCHPGSGYTSFGHLTWAKIVKIGVKIRLVNNFRLVSKLT